MRSFPYPLALLLPLLAFAGCAEQDPLDQADELMGRKRYSHAIVVYDRILAENPKSAAALIGRGRAHASAGKTEAALADFSQAILVDPRRSEAFYRRADVYEKLGDMAAANADVASAHEVDPDYRWAFANVEGPSAPRVDFEVDEEFEDWQARQPEAEHVAHVAAAEVAENDFDAFSGGWFDLSERQSRDSKLDREAYVSKYQPGMQIGESAVRSQAASDPLMKWKTAGDAATDPRTPFWLRRRMESSATTLAPTTTKAAKPVVVTPPAPVPNPYVRVPIPAPAGSASAQNKPASPGPQRPTGSPFPQAPVRSTGR
ncbi:MAG: tetratricopeptide repeat protein [Planctomycetia bacterium]|nr:tetratricopeptide repeat protein [Planctomycetia bacterium]